MLSDKMNKCSEYCWILLYKIELNWIEEWNTILLTDVFPQLWGRSWRTSLPPPPLPPSLCTAVCVLSVQSCWALSIFQFSANCWRRAASPAHLQSCLLALDLLRCEIAAVGWAFCSIRFFSFFIFFFSTGLLVWSDVFATHDLHPFEVWSIGTALCILQSSFCFIFFWEEFVKNWLQWWENDSSGSPMAIGHNTNYIFHLMNSHEAC